MRNREAELAKTKAIRDVEPECVLALTRYSTEEADEDFIANDEVDINNQNYIYNMQTGKYHERHYTDELWSCQAEDCDREPFVSGSGAGILQSQARRKLRKSILQISPLQGHKLHCSCGGG